MHRLQSMEVEIQNVQLVSKYIQKSAIIDSWEVYFPDQEGEIGERLVL